jgi:hypothetical protein
MLDVPFHVLHNTRYKFTAYLSHEFKISCDRHLDCVTSLDT